MQPHLYPLLFWMHRTPLPSCWTWHRRLLAAQHLPPYHTICALIRTCTPWLPALAINAQDTIAKLLDMAQGATDAEVAAGALQADCVHVLHRFMEPVPCSLMVSMMQRGVKCGKGTVCMCCTVLRSLSAGIGGVVHSAKRSNAYPVRVVINHPACQTALVHACACVYSDCA